MIDYTDVDAKLEEYSEAFDLYLECGKMPPSMPPDDCIKNNCIFAILFNKQINMLVFSKDLRLFNSGYFKT